CAALVAWIGIGRPNDNFLDTRGDNRIGAWLCAAMRGAGLKGHIKSRAAWTVAAEPGAVYRLDFRVGRAGAPVPSATDDAAALHQNRANHRVWRSHAITPTRRLQCQTHVVQMVRHAYELNDPNCSDAHSSRRAAA